MTAQTKQANKTIDNRYVPNTPAEQNRRTSPNKSFDQNNSGEKSPNKTSEQNISKSPRPNKAWNKTIPTDTPNNLSKTFLISFCWVPETFAQNIARTRPNKTSPSNTRTPFSISPDFDSSAKRKLERGPAFPPGDQPFQQVLVEFGLRLVCAIR